MDCSGFFQPSSIYLLRHYVFGFASDCGIASCRLFVIRSALDILGIISFGGCFCEYFSKCGIIKQFTSFNLVCHMLGDEKIKLPIYPDSVPHLM